MHSSSASPAHTGDELDSKIRHVRQLLEHSQFAPALAAAQTLRSRIPTHRDVLYMMAVAQRYLQQIPEALETLAELERWHPQYGRLFQERGYCFITQRRARPAIDAFLQGLVLNPSLPGSWRALRELYRMTGQMAFAEDAAAHLANLESLPPEVVTAFSMFADGEIQDAERLVRQYLLTHGDHVEAMRLLAQIGMKLDVVDDAEFLLENVMRLAPQHHVARYEYTLALLQRHKHVRAREEILKLLRIEPNSRIYRTTYATICCGLGDYTEALPLYRELLSGAPEDAEIHLSIGHAQKTLGHAPQAIESYRAAVQSRPGFGEAYWSLANLKTYRFTDNELDAMRSSERVAAVRAVDRYHLSFSLGKALEDRGEYAESFHYYERGNALKKLECRYRAESLESNARLQSQICSREFFASRAGFGCDSAAPIFIVGLPRSGSTLIEQILASHSQVEGTMELADIPRLVHELQGRTPPGSEGEPVSSYPSGLATLDAAACRGFGERYLKDTAIYRTLNRPYFIDKMPNNFRHIGLIHLIFPRAKLIDARREPLACCFSNFKQLFASGQQFTYSFEDLARYYRMYLGLMAHWEAALPGKILRIQHEELVDNAEPHVRRILEFCELRFEDNCLHFHKTVRRIHTASSEQVRRPLNRDGLDQWRHFEPWLGPLKSLLSPAAG